MITTLAALAAVCLLSLALILIIPHFAATKILMGFLPQDIREAAKGHPDPSFGRLMIGYLLTALAVAGFAGVVFFLGADGIRRGYGFWLQFGRYMLFMYGYKLFDILVQDQYIVITKKYYVKFYPETKDCKSWDDRSFNTKNQIIRLIAFPFVCALTAWITLIIGR
ncbi:hypothetical protein [Aristaeella lactis]|uniref:Uncharacterized protein n=1 Tax=Aristaeella lactis TaxID=3046383 RepID=A0AC61PKF4_9FIRM|nr:hypothetical protein [Aristaeella lactis]QUA51919.1 hypothetical protein JYE50_09330 [Aristaeella lactis]SMC53467.1 hypothetical protein SAMN06297397_1289 [Aristaeella lactis]